MTLNVSAFSKFAVFASIASLGLIVGCNNAVDKPAPLPAVGDLPAAPAGAPDAAKIKKASGVGSNAAQDSTQNGKAK
jgi:hypothetical protein